MRAAKRVLFVGVSLLQDVVIGLLAEQSDIEVIGTVDSWAQAKDQIANDAPDVIIMDHQKQELVEAELNPLLGSLKRPLNVISLTPTQNRIIIHDRTEITNASMPDLVNALTSSITGEADE